MINNADAETPPLKIVVNISDAQVSNHVDDEIITYSLGSCIGVAAYDPANKVGGILHYQLPSSKENAHAPQRNPCMFADTGMSRLLEEMERLGAQRKKLRIKIAGGAQMLNDANMFSIGKRNYAAIRQILWKNGMFIEKEDVGGNAARTMSLMMTDGAVMIRSQGSHHEL
ncbi:MAG: chemotaxis protein CheD [Sedimentisphaerales bacterium]|nr:chemotaxis protein CheD [Sedimentisphaerales bacterium]